MKENDSYICFVDKREDVGRKVKIESRKEVSSGEEAGGCKIFDHNYAKGAN